MALPRDADNWEAVDTLDDFAAYLELLSEEFERSRAGTEVSRWTHADVGAFLESFGAWVRDSYLQRGAPFAELRPEPSWREFARMLCVTRAYE
jgi:hypothetical protein